MDVDDLAPGQCGPFGGRAGKCAVLDSEETMLGLPSVSIARRRAQHAQVAINLRAVGIDDHAPKLLSISKRQRRLAACGRAGDDDEWRTDGHCDADSSGKAR